MTKPPDNGPWQYGTPPMPEESYRGPEPRDATWTWPATVAFLGLLGFFGFVLWMAFR